MDQASVTRFRAAERDGEAFALEGLWAVERALAAGLHVEVAFVCRTLLRGDRCEAVLAGVPTIDVGERTLRRMVARDGPDGIAAIARSRPPAVPTVDAGTRLLVADDLELAGNLGTLIRCADGAGCAAVVLAEPRLRVTSRAVVKASTGAVFSMPVLELARDEAIDWLGARGVRVVAADPAASTSYRDADYRGPVAVVVGNERRGLAGPWREAADAVVSIPMLGVADSLNVSHAAALLLYEALRASGAGVRSRSVERAQP